MCGSHILKQEAVTLKLPWRPQGVRDARAMGYLLKNVVAINKDEKGIGNLKTALTSAMEMQSFEFAQLVSCLALEITVMLCLSMAPIDSCF